RNHLMAVQTPQVFDRALYLYAHTAAQTEYNDDCQMLESVGIRVAISKGDECNIKLTTPDDFVVAEAFLGRRDGQ
ncbi:MAG: 2-C-methyl-D-erythritol 4-phosphate cytidylyltransferase, partial [Oscillospiraceae bacterium]